MSDRRIASEQGIGGGDFWWMFAGAYVSLSISLMALDWFGIVLPLPENVWFRLAALVLLAALSFCVVSAACSLLAKGLNVLLLAALRAATFMVARIETLMTGAVEYGRPLLIGLLSLPLLPLRFAYSRIYDAYIAPAAERRRQRAELRRLYEEVRDDYANFEEFARMFEGGEARRDGSHGNSGPDERGQQPAEEPADSFAIACRTFGLPEDGVFSAAHLKARYLEIMKAIHPDVIGPNLFASQLNEARALIKSRKGWK